MLWFIVTFLNFFPLLMNPIINFVIEHIYNNHRTITLKNEIIATNNLLKTISMIDNFPDYARKQRYLNKLKEELKQQEIKRSTRNLKLRLVLVNGMKLITYIFLIVLLWKNRFTPVFIVPVAWLSPWASILSWPTGIEGAISLSSWLVINGVVFRTIKN